MIINPLNIPSDDEFLVKNEPTDEAIAPREINTMEKHRQNSREPFTLLLMELSVPENIVK